MAAPGAFRSQRILCRSIATSFACLAIAWLLPVSWSSSIWTQGRCRSRAFLAKTFIGFSSNDLGMAGVFRCVGTRLSCQLESSDRELARGISRSRSSSAHIQGRSWRGEVRASAATSSNILFGQVTFQPAFADGCRLSTARGQVSTLAGLRRYAWLLPASCLSQSVVFIHRCDEPLSYNHADQPDDFAGCRAPVCAQSGTRSRPDATARLAVGAADGSIEQTYPERRLNYVSIHPAWLGTKPPCGHTGKVRRTSACFPAVPDSCMQHG